MKMTLSCLLLAPLATATLALAQAPTDAAPEPAAPDAQKATQESPAPLPNTVRPVAPGAAGGMGAALRSPVDRVIDSVLEPLDMTAEQQTRVGEIRAAWLERTQLLRDETRKSALALQSMNRSPGTAPAEIEAKRANLTAAQAALQEEVAKLDEEIAAALDPDRREKYLATREEMRSRTGRPANRPAVGTHPTPNTRR